VAQVASPIVRIDSIAVEGNVRLGATSIVGTLGFEVGSEITGREIQRAIKNLYGTGQFESVSVWAEGEAGEPVTLVVEVEERDVLSQVTISGLRRVSERMVRDSTGLQAGQPYSPARAFAAEQFIRSRLAREGVPFARIERSTQDLEGRPGEIHLVLDVTEGNRITIAQIQIHGNDDIADGEIRGAMKTKPEGFFWFRSGGYDEEQFTEDLQRALPDLYRSRGHLDFAILSDTLVVDPQTGKTRLELTVEEGPRYRLADFSVTGNRHFSTEEIERYFNRREGGLLRTLRLRRGDDDGREAYFDALAFEEARFEVEQLYRDEGFLYVQIDPWMERLPSEGDGAPEVRVGWRVEESNPAYVRRILVAGNDYTHERVIREKIFILPGSVYSQRDIISSYQSIASLGFFETPMPMPRIEPDEATGDVDITFVVQEKQTGSINFGTAVGGGTGVSGFLGYDQPNLFGQAKQGHLRWDFGRYINSFTLSFTDPSLRQSRVSGNISIFNSRDRFFQFATGRRRRAGFSTRFGIPLPVNWSQRTQVFVGYSLARTQYSLFQDVDDTSLFGLPPGTQSTFSLGISRNFLNHPLFPTMGSRQSWTTEFNGGILGGDGNFTRHLAEASWYIPAGELGGGEPGARPVRLTLGLTLRGGAVFGDVTNFPFDRFWMGGVQFGQQLRGYDETSITPLGYFTERSGEIADIQRLGNAYLSMTAEYAVRISDNISVSTFLDAGNVWRDPRSIDPTRLYRGAGLGVQLVTPFGPIGLDYAYGFDKTVPGWQLHFRMGPGF
jgi:outer membrane protein insertion porin family